VDTLEPISEIKLEAEDKNRIEWGVEGYSSKGFKVVWSKNENPTYPTREEDKYHYFSNPEKRSDFLDAFDGSGKYYVRVCEYKGGECGVYSNEAEIQLGKLKEVYEDEKHEERLLVCENGCALEESCLPFGFRNKGEYCSIDAEFTPQKEGESACENNFECKSNVCVSGECISQSLIKKVFDWLKGFFSRG